ncbi:MAG TPA: hypothetical protein ENI95_14080 [Chloroflexi bacterium]|nr:hypothetical protein [Chloroflexota bacterium]
MLIRRFTLSVVLLILLAGAMSACESFDISVQITTPPLKTDQPLYYDFNGDGVLDEDELMGEFAVYDGDGELTFTWQPVSVEGVAPENLSYRIALIQLDTTEPGRDLLADDVYLERKVSHHWATSPDGTTFTLGAFGFGEPFCFGCPTYIVVIPEIVEQVYDEATGTYTYEYTLIEDGFVQISETFLLESSR